MFKGANMQNIMKQAQKMQEKMAKTQDELKTRTIEATVGGGMVSVVFNGAQELLKITINKEAVDPEDVDTLQDLVLSAVNSGLKKSQEMVQEEMGKITGGMNIPGMF